ncbi:cytochrome c [Methylosinus sporium]|uniref:Cytochrome c n=1 Tax=Methylosinus sporium TaxID=428 RepID=A0A549SQT1_METSR|nr:MULTISPECIES: cytochrome c [Methylosinus]MBU3890586.1 cytochrome c [Methylosinus sp. KRF6]TRL31982.1 cytochrome c [Methylosinus sporium]
MKWRNAAIAAFCIGVSTGAARGAETDSRIPVALTAPEKAFVLDQMRLFVKSVEQIVTGLATGDKAMAVEAASARGAIRFRADGAMFPALNDKFPDKWKQLGQPMRKGFDELSKALAEGEDTMRALARLGSLMSNCVACHETYRIVDAKN